MPSTAPPVLVVCAVIIRDGLILLAQRPLGKRLAGLWEFPGGKVEQNETAEAALHRELSEELGCQVTLKLAGPPVVHEYEWGGVQLLPFVCHLTAGSSEPVAHEHQRLTWVAKANLLEWDLAPADVPVVHWLVEISIS